MPWKPVTEKFFDLNERRECAKFFKAVAGSQNGHLSAGELANKIIQRVNGTAQHLFELYIFEKTAGAEDYEITVAFDLSIHRETRMPRGNFKKWDWQVHVGVKASPTMKFDEIYEAILDRCRDFLDNIHPKQLWVVGDASLTIGNTHIIDLLYKKADTDARITWGGGPTDESVANYHYYRQDPPKGLGPSGKLRRRVIHNIA